MATYTKTFLKTLTDAELESIVEAETARRSEIVAHFAAVLPVEMDKTPGYSLRDWSNVHAAVDEVIRGEEKNSWVVRAEQRRRQTATTKAKNAQSRALAAIPQGSYEVGAAVEVHAFGHWYPGIVVKVGRSNVTCKYTSGAGTTREKSVNSTKVRKVS